MKIHHWMVALCVLFSALAMQSDYNIYGHLDEGHGEEQLPDGGVVRFLFLQPDGAYLENVGIVLRTITGDEMMRSTVSGPLSVGLPNGEYVLQARRADGGTKTQRFRVMSRQSRELVLVF